MVFGNLFSGLSNLFDKIIEVVIKLRIRIICCSKNMDNISVPHKQQISIDTDDTF
jgi:hypothetical protein